MLRPAANRLPNDAAQRPIESTNDCEFSRSSKTTLTAGCLIILRPMSNSFEMTVTQSRLDTGLLAIPKEHAAQLFPSRSTVIHVRLGNESAPSELKFVPAESSAKEPRIYGMRRWFNRERIRDGDKLKVVLLDRELWLYQLSRCLDGNVLESTPLVPGDEEYVEGRELFQLHRRKERNRRAVARKKRAALATCGRLLCEVCSFDFVEVYGQLGEGFAECHHRVPLSQLTPDHRTRLNDLAIVCANCHRMLHRRPTHRVDELREMVERFRAAR